jgi:hypothetical protein
MCRGTRHAGRQTACHMTRRTAERNPQLFLWYVAEHMHALRFPRARTRQSNDRNTPNARDGTMKRDPTKVRRCVECTEDATVGLDGKLY